MSFIILIFFHLCTLHYLLFVQCSLIETRKKKKKEKGQNEVWCLNLGFRKELVYLIKTEVVWGYKGQFIKVIKDKFGVIKSRFVCLVGWLFIRWKTYCATCSRYLSNTASYEASYEGSSFM